MLKELTQFTEAALADPVFRNLGVAPREGLHLILQVERTPEQVLVDENLLFSGTYSKKKTKELGEQLERCAAWSQVAWMVDTNKCFDPTVKAIHSASPFCFALKRTNLEGGEQYLNNQAESKSQVYERVNLYFSKAIALLEDEEEKKIAEAFHHALNDRDRLQRWLNTVEEYKSMKDGEYVIFYLDLPLEIYAAANGKYMKMNLFNTPDYNFPSKNDPEYGTSDWLNTFAAKKPFLRHQTATFSIAGRIPAKEAQLLYNFANLSSRRVFPNPLPLFILADERKRLSNEKENIREKAFKIFKEDAASVGTKRKTYLEIIEDLWKDYYDELGNYYLLFLNHQGEIRDFDFVSSFEYELKDGENKYWKVPDVFKFKNSRENTVENIAQLAAILPDIFNSQMIFRWFEDLDTKFFKKPNNYQIVMKYRKAVYDFIYKSQRQSLTQTAIREILMTGILDDISTDKKEYEGPRIRNKLNLLFSLHQHFYPQIKHPFFMPTKIEELRQHTDSVARGEAHLERDEQFAFAAGQMISRIYMQSETANRSFKYIEPFLRQSRVEQFRQNIQDFFVRYSHKPYSKRFAKVSSEVMTYQLNNEFGDFKTLRPIVLAGIFFRKNLLLAEDENINEDETQVTETDNK